MVGGLGALEDGVSEEHVLTVLQGRGSHPWATYTEPTPARLEAGATVPATFVSCTDKPHGDPLLALAAGLRGSGWDVRELPTGHFAMLSMPRALSDLLLALD